MPRLLDATALEPGAVAEAAAALRSGELVAFPTETVYGLGALASDERALERLFEAKGRPRSHPLIVHLADAAELPRWSARVPEAARRLADAFWPGPLTLVLAAASGVRPLVTGSQSTVALRVPAHPLAHALVAAVGAGVAAPSANRFGRVSPTTAAHVIEDFAAAPDRPSPVSIVLDGGPCPVGLESTIVDLSGSAPRALRPGAIAWDAIEEALGGPLLYGGADAPRAPGGHARHYAPGIPARIVPGDELAGVPADVAVIHRAADVGRGSRGVRARLGWVLADDPAGYARSLYAALREAERSGARELLIAAVPDGPAWAAVRDRLRRATAGAPTEEAP